MTQVSEARRRESAEPARPLFIKGAAMGDKGGKKDKEKSKQQRLKKQKQEDQKKQDKAQPRIP
jgi:hypothetical protein